jgi:peptide/nickel transport system permease protein
MRCEGLLTELQQAARVPPMESLRLSLQRVAPTGRTRFVLARLAAAVPLLLVVSILSFWLIQVLPGNTAQLLLGTDATEEQIAILESELRLDRPAWERYREWLGAALKGDLGRSLTSGQAIGALLLERLPVTLELVACALALALLFAVPTALLAARYPNSVIDRLTAVVSMAGLSMASYVLALLLVLIFAVKLALLPSLGFTPLAEDPWRNLRSLTLPAVALAIPLFSIYTRFLRSDLVEQLQNEDYIVAAAAKGAGPWRILVNHALRNSVLGLVAVVGTNIGPLVGGTVIMEQLFGLPGLGRLLLQSIHLRDVTIVQAAVLLLACITVCANLAADLLQAMLDPRIRHA